ncbi:MAG: diguanylate cyclase [Anaerolineales bacterium]|nr:diguanylate cyclase [Anaerolineales bacterium]
MRVLILEQDADHRQFLSEKLSSFGYDVVENGDGEGALEVIEDEPVQVILADYNMPDFGGSDLVNGILAANLTDYPYIILMTTQDNQKEAVDCLGPLPGDYLLKPVAEEDLRARVKIAERSIAMQARLRETIDQSEALAIYDHLTGVLNRQAMYERALAEVSRAQREGVPVSLAMLEIRNLQEIAEEQGNEVRDQSVRFVARATRANVRIYDLVGRWIGAKFLLLLPGASLENAQKVVERVSKSISTIRIRQPDGGRLQLEIVVGLARMPMDEAVPLYVLIEQANEALMQAAGDPEEHIKAYQEAA